MARLLVVSRSMALALRLADAHEVTELGLGDLGAMLPAPSIDAVVLDVGEPALAIQTVDRLRAAGNTTPLLIVSGYQPAWAGLVAVDVPGVVVVPLPITRSALLEGIDRLLAGRRPATPPVPAPPARVPAAPPPIPAAPRILPRQAAQVTAAKQEERPPPRLEPHAPDPVLVEPSLATVLPTDPVRLDPVGEAHPEASASPDLLRPYIRVAAPTPDEQGREPASWSDTAFDWWPELPEPVGTRAEPSPPDPVPPADLSAEELALSLDDQGRLSEDVAWAQRPVDPPSRPGSSDRELIVGLVAQLIDRVADAPGVGDSADLVAEQLVQVIQANAVAVLVPDGSVWRVSGGIGLRPLERRLVLDRRHWLVQQVGLESSALVLEDTDAVRQLLAGAPLAAWRYLLALPIAAVQAVVVLARGGESQPFTEADLPPLTLPLAAAAEALELAVRVRHLARLLAPLQENPPGTP